jgi:hypothetical protein
MQSVSLKKSLTLPRSARSRRFPYFLNALLVAVSLFPWAVPCHAQDTQTMQTAPVSKEKFDVGVGGFYQVTGAANGNFIRDDTTESGGALISFRQPWRPWMGWEANVGYTKFYESYNKNTVKVENNVTDVSFSYLFQSPAYYGVQAYLSLGGGIIVFSPIAGTVTNLNAPATGNLSSQLLPEFAYNFGLNYPLFKRFGVRGGLRGIKYKTPDFHQFTIDTKTLRTTLEPNLGVYYRF